MSESIVKADNHDEDIQLVFSRLKDLPKNGVMHLGAHKGEEVKYYREFGYKHIILVEANPDLCREIEKEFNGQPDINVFNYAVCDTNGSIDFHIHESRTGLESSSILKMDKFDSIVTSLKTSQTLTVPAVTIDHLVKEKNIDLLNYNILVSDIQGADFLALKGAAGSIQHFDAVVVEVQCIALYENFISENTMDELMASYGFKKDFVIYHELYQGENRFPAWGEAIYLNTKGK